MYKFFQSFGRMATDSSFRGSLSYLLPQVPTNLSSERRYYLSTATIVRNEAKFIREFVAFHKIVGVDHMLIYDDSSEDDLRSEICDFIASGFVEVVPWPRFLFNKNHQFAAYQHAVAYLTGVTSWIAMIDADEFLFAPATGDLKSELKKRESFSALSVYSRTFGTGGVHTLSRGDFVTARLTRRAVTTHVKNYTQRTIVKPEFVVAIRSANTCVLRDTNKLGWDENGIPVFKTGEAGHGSEALRINHYFTRAEDDFRTKLLRKYFGRTLHFQKMAAKIQEAADNSLSVEEDFTLHQYTPQLLETYGSSLSSKVKVTVTKKISKKTEYLK